MHKSSLHILIMHKSFFRTIDLNMNENIPQPINLTICESFTNNLLCFYNYVKVLDKNLIGIELYIMIPRINLF